MKTKWNNSHKHTRKHAKNIPRPNVENVQNANEQTDTRNQQHPRRLLHSQLRAEEDSPATSPRWCHAVSTTRNAF